MCRLGYHFSVLLFLSLVLFSTFVKVCTHLRVVVVYFSISWSAVMNLALQTENAIFQLKYYNNICCIHTCACV